MSKEATTTTTAAAATTTTTTTTTTHSSSFKTPATSTAIIVHPTHSKGILSSIIPTFRAERQVVLPFLPNGPRIITLRQGTDHQNVGVLLWRSGIAMSIYLGKEIQEKRIDVSNKSCVELGCGCSPLVSLVASEYGASQSIATDYNSDVLNLASLNIRKNYIGTGNVVAVSLLKWGENEHIQNILKNKDKPFDYVFAADVMYAPHTHDVLIETMLKLSHLKTVFYIGYQVRLHAFEGIFFKELLPSNGFSCEIVWTGDKNRVHIVRCQRES
jgi:predicted nicotinamide N-methyase